MLSGSLILASMLLAANGAPDVWYMKDKGFAIPIRIRPEARADISKLVLYWSRDENHTIWDVCATAKPEQESFGVTAQGDGSYWFKVAVVKKNGQQDPPAADINTSPVGQRIVVDSTKPDIKLVVAERRGDDVYVRWEIREENPDPTTLKFDYHTAEMAPDQWTPVAVTPDSHGRGEVTFNPHSGSAVRVRMKLQDLALNVGETSMEIPASTFVPPSPTGQTTSSWAPVGPPTGTPTEMVPVKPPESAPPTPLPPSSGTVGFTTTNSVNTFTQSVPVPPVPPPAPVAAATGSNPVAASSSLNGGPLPAKQIINKRQVRLEFEVARYGPSGIGAVDVYLTTDDGRNWEKAPPDPSLNLPMVSPIQGGPMRGVVTAQLPREAVVYGIAVVVKSRAGLGKPPPRNGELPQMRVEVDTTSPVAQLFEPQNDLNHRDSLILTWTADDRNLAPNPITLEWAAQRDGPWNLIGSDQMPNTGVYNWQVPTSVPPSVYLRMTVRDLAGNASVAQTNKAVLVDLSEPVANIIGLAGSTPER
jgi:hypothetical protein